MGWGSRPIDRVKIAYENSFLVIAIILKTEEAGGVSDEVLIGFARATSDHAFNATIWDVSARPTLGWPTHVLYRKGLKTIFRDAWS